MTNTVEAVQESKFEMRKLKATDVFAMSKILKKMNLKGQLDFAGKSQEQVGQDLFITIIENIGSAEDEFNTFFGSLVGITSKEFAELDIDELFEVFALFKKQDGVSRFLQLLK